MSDGILVQSSWYEINDMIVTILQRGAPPGVETLCDDRALRVAINSPCFLRQQTSSSPSSRSLRFSVSGPGDLPYTGPDYVTAVSQSV